jgi:hypothetical protein
MSAVKQAGGQGEPEKGKQTAAQKKRTRTTSQAPTTQPASLAADLFVAALAAIPPDDWGRTWAEGRTIMLRRTSKRVKEVVDKMRLPAVVRLSWRFWDQYSNDTETAKRQEMLVFQAVVRDGDRVTVWKKLSRAGVESLINYGAQFLNNYQNAICGPTRVMWPHSHCMPPLCCAAYNGQFVLRQLTLMTAWCRITTLELPRCDMEGQNAERLAGVLAQCPALAHLDLSSNSIGSAGAERLAGVLGQCASLAHLNLSDNRIHAAGAEGLARVLAKCPALTHLNLGDNKIGAERLAGVLGQCAALAHLNLSYNQIGNAGAERLAGVLAQCTALAHLNLWGNKIGAAGVERLAGVLGQCAALAHLDLSYNQIGPAGAESLAGVLGQCTALAHLNLGYNYIGGVGRRRLRASWRGQASGLVL